MSAAADALFRHVFLPGPVAVHPDVMQAMLRPMESHRSAAMSARLAAMQPTLKAIFRTTRPVIVATASATGLKEMAMRSAVTETVLVPVGGLFAERFAVIAERCGKRVVRLPVPPETPVLPDALAAALLEHPEVDSVALVHSETGTGVLAPLQVLAGVVRTLRPEVMLIVDGVTSVGGSPVETDAWGLDLVLTGSQKALGLPPGLALAVASERCVARARTLPNRGWYLDLQTLQRAADGDTFPQTPALPLINALEFQLGRIAAEGIEARWARHAALCARMDAWADTTGWPILAPRGARSWTVTAISLPLTLPAARVVDAMAARGFTITDGLPPASTACVRVGHMGDLQPDHLTDVLAALDAVLRELVSP